LEEFKATVLERAGVDSIEEFESLPNPAKSAEADKQTLAKIKRLEADLKLEKDARAELDGRYTSERVDSELSKVAAKLQFIDTDTLSALMRQHVVIEDGKATYRKDGAAMPLDEAAALIAKNKPFLVKATGNSGSGAPPAGSKQAGNNQITRTQFDAMTPQDKMAAVKAGVVIS
jgi:hypothetical protein